MQERAGNGLLSAERRHAILSALERDGKVLAGRLAWKNDEFLNLLQTYKYRDDVVMTGYLDEAELARLIGAAYALVYPSLFEGFGVPVVEAMKCGVPVLTSAGSALEEIGGEAALYFKPEDFSDIADKLMRIYKDEGLRNQLVEKGKTVAAGFTWERTAGLVWDVVKKVMERRELSDQGL